MAAELRQLWPGLQIDLKIIKTTGDRITDKPLHDVGGKGLFTKELEIALLNGEIDFAVHSCKDVPVTLPLVDGSGLVIAAVPKRQDSRDVLVVGPNVRAIGDLPTGATVGTGSLRRQCQLLSLRPDLKIVPLRGNVDTRLRKQRDGEMDAVVLAAAGLIRAGLFDTDRMVAIPVEQMVPSAAQGALALQCRADDESTRGVLAAMNHPASHECIKIERHVIQLLNADCHSPIGVHAEIQHTDEMTVAIAIGNQTLEQMARFSVAGPMGSISQLIREKLKQGNLCL